MYVLNSLQTQSKEIQFKILYFFFMHIFNCDFTLRKGTDFVIGPRETFF